MFIIYICVYIYNYTYIYTDYIYIAHSDWILPQNCGHLMIFWTIIIVIKNPAKFRVSRGHDHEAWSVGLTLIMPVTLADVLGIWNTCMFVSIMCVEVVSPVGQNSNKSKSKKLQKYIFEKKRHFLDLFFGWTPGWWSLS